MYSKSFQSAIDDEPLAAAFMLGNLYCALDDAERPNKDLYQKALKQAKKMLTQVRVQNLWQKIVSIPHAHWSIMDSANQLSLIKLKQQMVRDLDYSQHLDADALIKEGQHILSYREILIALIRNHLLIKASNSPFTEKDFSYELLSQGGAGQNFLYLSGFIKQCAFIPLEQIVQLGQTQDIIAELILKDFTSCDCYFELSSRFAQIHPSLRKPVAIEWQGQLETFPVPAAQAQLIVTELPKLQSQYPEFSNVQLDNCAKQQFEVGPKPEKKYHPFFTYSATAITYIGYAQQGAKIASVVSAIAGGAPMVPVVAPLLFRYAANAGISWLVGKIAVNFKKAKPKPFG